MMVRLLAFALHADEALEFGRGLSAEDEPDLWQRDLTGAIERWIDVGLPDERAVRKACGRARSVDILAYGGRAVELWWEGARARLERQEGLTVTEVPPRRKPGARPIGRPLDAPAGHDPGGTRPGRRRRELDFDRFAAAEGCADPALTDSREAGRFIRLAPRLRQQERSPAARRAEWADEQPVRIARVMKYCRAPKTRATLPIDACPPNNPFPAWPAGCTLRARRPCGQEHRLHRHRQLAQRKGNVAPGPAGGQISVCRAGRAGPPRLAGVGLPTRACVATFWSFPVISTAEPSSIPIASTRANRCRSPNWNARPAALPAPACFRS